VYEPGEVKAIAYNADGSVAGEAVVRTAGKPYALKLTSNRSSLEADGDDLAYVTVQVIDKDGNVVPDAEPEVSFKVTGDGSFRATANGDPTSLRDFNKPVMDLFSGAATVIVKSGEKPGSLTLEAKSKGLKPARLTLPVR
ncbi:MAG: beta-galactosidase, partial [Muribaculaceae bacterium]|nr:beta-galactosidase [Muribaculaceae bacterium]